MSTPIIKVKNLKKVYPRVSGHRRVEVFSDISLHIMKGEFLVLLGPSGCGKSTFLRIVAGLDQSSDDDIEYAEGFNKNNISFVFQNFGLLPWLTVGQNVSIGLIQSKDPKHEIAKKTDEMLEKFGLLSFKNSFPHELSGGMKQRVGLARAFITQPEIIFLDEPFSELDFFTARGLREILLNMWRENGTTVVMVSHYIDEAVFLSDKIAVFSDRPSTVKKIFDNGLPRPREYRSEPFYKVEDEVLKYFEDNK